jgi:phosphate starvation-inducible PhoH-like protein
MAKKSKIRKRHEEFERETSNANNMLTRECNPKMVVAITAKNPGQKAALKSIHTNKVTFLFGAPGTGKTYIATGYGIQELLRGRFDKIIFTRPAVEAGENLGYLPGTFDAKLAPYLMPMYDVLADFLSLEEIQELEEQRKIITLPLAFQRGITFKNAYVIADECQNASPKQMHLLLTRLGEGSKIIVTGDVFQSDLKGDRPNGLIDAIKRLQKIPTVSFIELDYSSNCREEIVSHIDQRYRKEQFTSERVLPAIMREIDPNYVEPELEAQLVDYDEYKDTHK